MTYNNDGHCQNSWTVEGADDSAGAGSSINGAGGNTSAGVGEGNEGGPSVDAGGNVWLIGNDEWDGQYQLIGYFDITKTMTWFLILIKIACSIQCILPLIILIQ